MIGQKDRYIGQILNSGTKDRHGQKDKNLKRQTP